MTIKSFLNDKDRSNLVTINAFSSFAETILKEFQEHGVDKEMITFLKYISTYGDKFVEKWISDLDEDEKVNLLKHLKDVEVVIKTKLSAKLEYERQAKRDANTILNEKQYLDVFELCLASCSMCSIDGKDCRFKKTFIEVNLTPLNPDAGEGECPYRYAGKKDRTKLLEVFKNIVEGVDSNESK